jgi:hypothetical protein
MAGVTWSPAHHWFLVWSVIGVASAALLAALVLALPLLAPQLVIAHSPWMGPVVLAEAYETGGIDPDFLPSTPVPPRQRVSLLDRVLAEERWQAWPGPRLAPLLGHADLRVQRTVTSLAMHLVRDGHLAVDSDLRDALVRTMGNPDRYVFEACFSILLGCEGAIVGAAILQHLPRRCGLSPSRATWDFSDFHDVNGAPASGLAAMRWCDLIAATAPWLASPDEDLQRLACRVLRFSDDTRAPALLAARLGRLLVSDESGNVFDAVAYGLGGNPQAAALDQLDAARRDPSADRRRSVARALIIRGLRPGLDTALPILKRMSDDDDDTVRIIVAEGLILYPLDLVVDDLRVLLARGGRPTTAALDALRHQRRLLHRSRPWWGRAEVVTGRDMPENLALEGRLFALVQGLAGHPEAEVRLAAARYLTQTWEPGTEAALRALADDPDPRVRAERAELHAIDGRTLRPAGDPPLDE